jgi:hypothetical protein
LVSHAICCFWIYHFRDSFWTLFCWVHWKYIYFCDKLTGILKSSAYTLQNARTQSKAVVTNKLAWIRAYLKNYICSAGQDTLWCFLMKSKGHDLIQNSWSLGVILSQKSLFRNIITSFLGLILVLLLCM